MTGISRRRVLAAGAAGGAFGTTACAGGPGQPGAPSRTLGGSVQFWTNPQYPFNEDVGGEIARDFAARTSGVTVEGVPTPGSMVEKVTAAAAGGTPPDLATVDIYTPQSLAASGATRAVEDYLKGSRAVKKSDLWPTHVTDLTSKGSLVAMPMGPDLRILYISSDRYRATGLDPDKPPRTWELQFAFATYPVPPNGKRANYGGGWANVLSSGAKNPEAAWAFLEFLSEDEQNLKLVDRYDQLPIRVATARSERFTKKDPFRILAAEEIPYRKFVIAAPGGSETLPIQAAMVNSILQGQVSVSDGLKDGQDQMQQVLDRWRR
jgi:ABC-type glycerol-3-phosphate transport system substrate-binding protein